MGTLKDLTGMRFGRLLVERKLGNDKYGNIQWDCLCDCGNRKSATASALRRGDTSSCGCLYKESRRTPKDLTGLVQGRLTVIQKSRERNNRGWLCSCACGREAVISHTSLLRGVGSCGCLRSEGLRARATTHGLSDTRIYHVWLGMIKRCTNTSCAAYANYGARGISVCSEWLDDFMSFYNWAIASGYDDTLTIERVDNSGNYCPGNCRWATRKEQNRNTRQNRILEYDGEFRCLNEWAELFGLTRDVLRSRLRYGWSVEKALTTPVKKSNRKVSKPKNEVVRKRH